MGSDPAALTSVCVFCGSSDDAAPAYLAAAADLGRALAADGLRLVYGGGGVGLMGACARAADEAGGRVLGIIPTFLIAQERRLDTVETVRVNSMHERKMLMFESSDAFVILPGGVGTLEEVVEILSWRRLDLHAKPIVFYNPDDFWGPLFALFRHTVDARLTPAGFMDCWTAVQQVDEILPAVRAALPQPAPNPAIARLT